MKLASSASSNVEEGTCRLRPRSRQFDRHHHEARAGAPGPENRRPSSGTSSSSVNPKKYASCSSSWLAATWLRGPSRFQMKGSSQIWSWLITASPTVPNSLNPFCPGRIVREAEAPGSRDRRKDNPAPCDHSPGPETESRLVGDVDLNLIAVGRGLDTGNVLSRALPAARQTCSPKLSRAQN